MKLAPGVRLGPYEIVAPIGAGGMGEVYSATDTRLGRMVAVKVLPSEFAFDAKLKIRFEREAKAISTLNHPNICALFDVGDNYLVMELLEGESLADRIARGPLSIPEVLRIGIQIAQGLQQAHWRGIVHRDLKPGNVMLTPSGAKLVDFGLAKTVAAPLDIDESTTRHKPLTGAHALVGTIESMAPEQVQGLDVDPRTDIFALGALLYEMTTGRHPFRGNSPIATMAAITEHEPPAIAELEPRTPAVLERLILQCLAKSPAHRFQSSGDVQVVLEWIAADMLSEKRHRRPFFRGKVAAVIAVAAFVCAGLAWRLARNTVVPAATVVETAIVPGGDVGGSSISPDGRLLVYQARDAEGRPTLWMRELTSDQTRAVASSRTIGGAFAAAPPAWSPDSTSVVFSADGELRRLNVITGAIDPILPLATFFGASVNARGTILIATTTGVARVEAGQLRYVTHVDVQRGELAHRWPSFLPDGERFLFSSITARGNTIHLGSLSAAHSRSILRCDTGAVYARPGYILCANQGRLFAHRFDASDGVVGSPAAIASGVAHSGTHRWFSVSETGVLVFVKALPYGMPSRLVWFDRRGHEIGALGSTANYFDPAVSRDGRRIAVRQSEDAIGFPARIAVYDLARNVPTTFDTEHAFDAASPVWSPDDRLLYFSSGSDEAVFDIFSKGVAGGPRVEVVTSPERKFITDVSLDGRHALLTVVNNDMSSVRSVALHDGSITPLGRDEESLSSAKFSPNSDWIAYSAIENGRSDVFVAAFPTLASKVRVSSRGGATPQWSREGRKIWYYEPSGAIVEANIQLGETAEVTDTRVLFTAAVKESPNAQFAVSPDGERFLLNVPIGSLPPTFTVVQNWTGRLER